MSPDAPVRHGAGRVDPRRRSRCSARTSPATSWAPSASASWPSGWRPSAGPRPGDPGVRGGARRAGRPRLHPDRDRHAADLPVRAGLRAGRAGRRPARRRLAVPRRHRGLRPLPARRARRHGRAPRRRRRLGRPGARDGHRAAKARRFVPGLGHHVHKTATRAPRGCSRSPPRRACSARTCGCSPRSAGCTRRCWAGRCRSTAPASAGRPWPTSGCRVELLRGFALLARAAGLIGQIAEELRHPVANDVFLSVDRNAGRTVDPYVARAGGGAGHRARRRPHRPRAGARPGPSTPTRSPAPAQRRPRDGRADRAPGPAVRVRAPPTSARRPALRAGHPGRRRRRGVRDPRRPAPGSASPRAPAWRPATAASPSGARPRRRRSCPSTSDVPDAELAALGSPPSRPGRSLDRAGPGSGPGERCSCSAAGGRSARPPSVRPGCWAPPGWSPSAARRRRGSARGGPGRTPSSR